MAAAVANSFWQRPGGSEAAVVTAGQGVGGTAAAQCQRRPGLMAAVAGRWS